MFPPGKACKERKAKKEEDYQEDCEEAEEAAPKEPFWQEGQGCCKVKQTRQCFGKK